MGIRSFSPKSKGRARRMPPATILLFAAGAVLAGILVVRSIARHDELVKWRGDLEAAAGNPPWPEWVASWPALPEPKSLNRRPIGDVKGPYAYAATHQEILRAIPCYCGCVREGHQSVLQCFLSGSRSDGSPVWTDHSFTCTTCIHIVREVMLMSSQGRGVVDIRRTIEARYSAVGTPTHTQPANH